MYQSEEVAEEHPFLQSLDPAHGQFITGCATQERFDVDQYMVREGHQANKFYLIQKGKVVLSTFMPQHHYATIQTLGENDPIGWSWLIPPHRWQFSARVVKRTTALAIDGNAVRQKCDEDCQFGYQILQQIIGLIGQRLRDTRMRLR